MRQANICGCSRLRYCRRLKQTRGRIHEHVASRARKLVRTMPPSHCRHMPAKTTGTTVARSLVVPRQCPAPLVPMLPAPGWPDRVPRKRPLRSTLSQLVDPSSELLGMPPVWPISPFYPLQSPLPTTRRQKLPRICQAYLDKNLNIATDPTAQAAEADLHPIRRSRYGS